MLALPAKIHSFRPRSCDKSHSFGKCARRILEVTLAKCDFAALDIKRKTKRKRAGAAQAASAFSFFACLKTTPKSAWIINQKSGGRTPSASADTLARTSETNGRSSTLKQPTSPTPDVQAPSLTSETGRRIKTTSTSSISQNAENVNAIRKRLREYNAPLRVAAELCFAARSFS